MRLYHLTHKVEPVSAATGGEQGLRLAIVP
jgi:hypothetical protein